MATDCVSMLRGRMMRLTKLDECGAPVEGAGSTLTASAFVSGTFTPNYQDPTETTVLDAAGNLCIDDRSRVQLRWIDLSLIICTVDPTLINIITGDPLVVDDATPTPNTVGFRIDTDLSGTASFAAEFWSDVDGQACDTAGFPKYGYWLFPWVKDAQWGEWVIQNGELLVTLTARAVIGSQWDVGPYDIRRDATTPATLEPLLTPIGPTQAMHFQTTTAPLPTAACGATALVIP
ncbi:hypothetical protein ACIGBL_33335 [Streptomyces sp. NPDC085614]|uniref:hypothetical protein n=1 Tax=Streptomyces sp. NPDC085614 TaxID=3365733 RepID=UPI0037D231A3